METERCVGRRNTTAGHPPCQLCVQGGRGCQFQGRMARCCFFLCVISGSRVPFRMVSGESYIAEFASGGLLKNPGDELAGNPKCPLV